jgi:hypothetical protein
MGTVFKCAYEPGNNKTSHYKKIDFFNLPFLVYFFPSPYFSCSYFLFFYILIDKKINYKESHSATLFLLYVDAKH